MSVRNSISLRSCVAASILCILAGAVPVQAQDDHSVARLWNEELLQSIRSDFARPTVHARNLFHISAAMYDAWAAYDDRARPFLLGQAVGRFGCPFQGFPAPYGDVKPAQEEAISFAAYRILKHRFANSPLPSIKMAGYDALMHELGYDTTDVSTDYRSGSPAALGNYIASCMIAFGLQDGSNEAGEYENRFYHPVNQPLAPSLPGSQSISDRNRWQPLTLKVFIDQSGHVVVGGGREFLSPEWGGVVPFALDESDLTLYDRDGYTWWVYHDPGPPPLLDTLDDRGLADPYKWSFDLVSAWSAHLDPSDGVMWDVSPASIGNANFLPQSFEEHPSFYKLKEGGDIGTGHDVNPYTGEPYEPQYVPRGDYTRVLAEFWADGPDSETPPGHWFTILNYVNDHPLFEKRYRGQGPIVDDLEWDVKAYFTLGGAMHDAAVTAWGIKGYYDYIRPISAIRSMAEHGQCSDPDLAKYSPDGIPLIPDYIEVVGPDDPLAGDSLEHVDKIKVKAWRGPDYIESPAVDQAGVDWILAENWWPYQRPSFVTPPFAGYISGHSTFSRAAAVVMTQLTGDPFFPGGLGEFVAKKNEFLVFEEGPSVDVVLQWATYRDASDQTSLSRIWGGIHPPADDIAGRIIGEKIGADAFNYAAQHFTGVFVGAEDDVIPSETSALELYPNPVQSGQTLSIVGPVATGRSMIELFDVTGRQVRRALAHSVVLREIDTSGLAPGMYFIRLSTGDRTADNKVVVY